ncbi:hypothetical protein PPSIR1_00952 [Plesiocystis pacifica SIR-1]|uniref:Uncharacterized protein n=1 Tax=Plesiocystis pacifica SIR-1 TaxID=391625 RepID=A6GCC4_9BACT|nr:nucleoside 2-deoxyribosyltransferase domain-containing protein [Plesiocystis pacifica]EDM76483.1 hypothetical protein PPSIR1_00952 [Plesiocystis pacifica SIR-1]
MEDWQARVGVALADVPDLLVLNPRRREWDASWRQAIDEPKFRGQVEWELDGLDSADRIAFYFAPDTKAPISLLELGLYARAGRAIVCWPEGVLAQGQRGHRVRAPWRGPGRRSRRPRRAAA